MQSTQDSPALPSSPRSLAFCTAVVTLGLLGLFSRPGALGAQVALELEAGSARIWSRSAAPERVSMPTDRLARVAVAAEGGYVIAGDNLGTGDLFFVHRAGGLTTELPTPPSQTGVLRSAPVLLTTGDRLEGTAWLEGSSQQDFSVLASVWNGTSWENVEVVSIQDSGPQLALSAAVLDDGSWLVLWAGYDGTDDDIFWSRRVNRTWSQPRRLHPDNQVPDILPTVAAHGNSAHAAWSFFDGNDYRTRTARWSGTGWTSGPTLAGRGSGRAAFENVAGRSFLTYQTVVPETWNLVEFDLEGTTPRTAVVGRYPERPLVTLEDGSEPSLSWPWRRESRP
ncbi:MAG: hypothetical protein GY769_13620 [bacterium]|nr:hypothetical protein [bacterium]